ncbi:MAG TPA: hypothetical protein DEV64_06035 [Rhodospirillaceae bacterium]|nr:hypothetical protein [Rhodospirillaceae bacterium]
MAGFADGVYVGGPEELAALTVAVGLWALASGLFPAFHGRTRGLGYFMLVGAVSWSAGLVLFAAQTSFTKGFIAISGASLLLITCHLGAYSLI